ncbi:MAG: HAD-IC family P-type ATPase [Patescibacteria group bacterium]|nr:HAD-IC family P-type ATPase [Patescibacteria group bacterium]
MDKYYCVKVQDVLESLDTGREGLSRAEAESRLEKYGPNKLPRSRRLSFVRLFLAQFKSPFAIILGVSGIVSLVVGHQSDFIIIFAALAVTAVVGFLQEYKASKALENLRKLVRPQASVRRSGVVSEINATNIVPGDIVLLRVGDKIPADGRIITAQNLEVNEAPLTGESIPSFKQLEVLKRDVVLADRSNMVYAGTTVSRGEGVFVVTHTGESTELGKLAEMMRGIEEEKTPLQQKLARLGKTVAIILTAASGAVFFLGMARGIPIPDILMTSVALAVASVPEGLPATLTVVLALGMQRLSRRGGLVRSLQAAETLGSASVICVDKTGTFTEGQLAVERWDFSQEDLGKLASVLCNNKQNYIDQALLGEFGNDDEFDSFQKILEVPFTSSRKYMAVAVEQKGRRNEGFRENYIFIKGAPEIILSKCNFSPKQRDQFEQQVEQWANAGLRVLGLAFKQGEQDFDFQEELMQSAEQGFTFLGLVAFSDPLRPEVQGAMEKCITAGIRVVIVTGDHKLTALSIAKQAGLVVEESQVVEGQELGKMADRELQREADNAVIFARVEPRHKVRILNALRANGEVVAMTGDGVNDAPALKIADIGVALGSGTDVAKEAADLVLTDDNFGTIVAAIEQGRIVFENIREVALYLLSDSFQEILLVGGSIIFGWPLPMLPAQILWVNFVEDGFPGVALAFDSGEGEVMRKSPREKTEPILDRGMKILILLVGLIDDIGFLVLFWLLLQGGYPLLVVRSFIFAAFSMNSLFYVFSCASLYQSVFNYNIFSNKLLLGSVLGGTASVIAAMYLPPLQKLLQVGPLPGSLWLLVILVIVLDFILIETAKFYFIVKNQWE